MLCFDNDLFDQYLSPATGLFFVYLVAMADDNGVVCTSLNKLESETGYDKNRLRQMITELSSLHTIYTQPTHRGSTITISNINSYKNKKRTVTHYLHTENTVNEVFDDEFSFDKIWELYRKKKGRNKVLVKRWQNLTLDERQKIFEFVPAYVALTEESYRQQFSTFLNQRTWENEKIYTNNISVPFGSFNAKLVEDPSLFPKFVERFNMKVSGSGIPPIDMDTGLTDKRRVLFNIAYCLHFYQMKDVVEKAIKNPRLNGSMGFAADFDYIFKPENFIRIYEGK